MENAVVLSQVLGIIYLALGLGMLIDSKHYHRLHTDFFKNHALVYVGAVLIITVGFFIVRWHNIWTPNWEIIITILGWFLLLKGLLLLLFPTRFLRQFESMFKTERHFFYYGWMVFLIGMVFAYFGFIHPML